MNNDDHRWSWFSEFDDLTIVKNGDFPPLLNYQRVSLFFKSFLIVHKYFIRKKGWDGMHADCVRSKCVLPKTLQSCRKPELWWELFFMAEWSRIVMNHGLQLVVPTNETRLESHSEQKSQFVAPGLGPNFWLRLPSKPVWLSCQKVDGFME